MKDDQWILEEKEKPFYCEWQSSYQLAHDQNLVIMVKEMRPDSNGSMRYWVNLHPASVHSYGVEIKSLVKEIETRFPNCLNTLPHKRMQSKRKGFRCHRGMAMRVSFSIKPKR